MAAVKKTRRNATIGKGLPGPGRPKGKPNKLTRDVKEMVLGALSAAGGKRYLRKQADENPGAFLSLVGKLLPKQITGENGTPLMPAPQFVVRPVRALSDQELEDIAREGRPKDQARRE